MTQRWQSVGRSVGPVPIGQAGEKKNTLYISLKTPWFPVSVHHLVPSQWDMSTLLPSPALEDGKYPGSESCVMFYCDVVAKVQKHGYRKHKISTIKEFSKWTLNVLTHCGRVTQICVFNTVKLGTSASSP